MELKGNKTFFIALVAIVASWAALYFSMVTPDIFEKVLTWSLGVYGARTVTKKLAATKLEASK